MLFRFFLPVLFSSSLVLARTDIEKVVPEFSSMQLIERPFLLIEIWGKDQIPAAVKKKFSKVLIDRNAITWELAKAASVNDLIASSVASGDTETPFLLEEFIPFFNPLAPVNEQNNILLLQLQTCSKLEATKLITSSYRLSDFKDRCKDLIQSSFLTDLQKLSVFAYLTFQRDLHSENVLIHYDGNSLKPVAIDFESSLSEKPKLGYFPVYKKEAPFKFPFFIEEYPLVETENSRSQINQMVENWNDHKFLPLLKKYSFSEEDILSFQKRLSRLKRTLREYPHVAIHTILTILFYEIPAHSDDYLNRIFANQAEDLRNKYDQ